MSHTGARAGDCKSAVEHTEYGPFTPTPELKMELEYKVVQSTTPLFAKLQNIDAIMAEESKAGWQLVEKFDNYKLRLQRDISHRANDKALPFDAYRTQVGVSNVVTYGLAAALTLGAVYLIFVIVGAV
jgi:hypothetical protein